MIACNYHPEGAVVTKLADVEGPMLLADPEVGTDSHCFHKLSRSCSSPKLLPDLCMPK